MRWLRRRELLELLFFLVRAGPDADHALDESFALLAATATATATPAPPPPAAVFAHGSPTIVGCRVLADGLAFRQLRHDAELRLFHVPVFLVRCARQALTGQHDEVALPAASA